MITSFSPKGKLSSKDKYKNYDLNNDSKILSHCETEVGNDNSSNYSKNIFSLSNSNLNSKTNMESQSKNINETLPGIIDLINENNLNFFYEDDKTNFKRNVDYLNIKFYLETEKILASPNNYNTNNLFLILFKQISLYIKEIERLNILILELKKNNSGNNNISFIDKKLQKIFEQKKIDNKIIQSLRNKICNLENDIKKFLQEENALKKENQKLLNELEIFKKTMSSNKITCTETIKSSEKINRYFSGERIEKKEIKISKNNKNKISKNKSYINDNNSSSNNIISVKRDEGLLMKRHRRNYSEQIEVNSLLNGNNKNIDINCNINNKINKPLKSVLRNNTSKNNQNKNKINNKDTLNTTTNDISTIGLKSPKPIKNINYPNKNKLEKKLKNVDNLNVNENKLFKRKNVTSNKNKNNSSKQQLDLLTNTDCSMTKYRSSIFNKSNVNTNAKKSSSGYIQGNIKNRKNSGNYVNDEIYDLTKCEVLLNELKLYLVNKNDSKNKNKPNNENNQSDIKHNEIYDTPPYVIRNKSIKHNTHEKTVSFKLFIDE